MSSSSAPAIIFIALCIVFGTAESVEENLKISGNSTDVVGTTNETRPNFAVANSSSLGESGANSSSKGYNPEANLMSGWMVLGANVFALVVMCIAVYVCFMECRGPKLPKGCEQQEEPDVDPTLRESRRWVQNENEVGIDKEDEAPLLSD